MANIAKMVDPRDDDFGAVINCAVRYALGRRSYMPEIVVNFTVPLVHELTNKTLWAIRRDIAEAQERDMLGDPCDAKDWLRLLAAVEKELSDRT